MIEYAKKYHIGIPSSKVLYNLNVLNFKNVKNKIEQVVDRGGLGIIYGNNLEKHRKSIKPRNSCTREISIIEGKVYISVMNTKRKFVCYTRDLQADVVWNSILNIIE